MMDKKKKAGIIVDVLMFALLLIQMLYVFTGNTAHEILGIGFFACVVIHIIIKRWWCASLFKKRESKRSKLRLTSDIITVLLICCIIALMLSSMGVSRLIFPWFEYLGSADLHRYLATAVLSLAALHGGMYFIIRAKKKKKAITLTALAVIAAAAVGLALVPYMNRHFKKVDISLSEKVSGDKAEWTGGRVLTVYFTRLGNTDFDDDVDAVSGASLMIADGELMGNDQLLALMMQDITGCDIKPVTITGKRYPSSYNDTIGVAMDEKRNNARPAIEKIDISGYDDIVLIYPLWWGDVPMPVATFLEENDFSGKHIYLIATQGSSGFSSSTATVKKLASGASVEEVMSIYCDDIPDSRQRLYEWVKNR
ncbi:MAG: hypothetical protein IKR76_07090 [Ruminococcus sp.]|nr:hypothetical protein [Ruminococcus sp.]